jgi:flagellar basal-body rod modification protein FlgD
VTISPVSLASGSATFSQNVSKDAFLNLLILQLRNQDPLNPLSNEDMLAQLAQFSALEEMQDLNGTMASQVVMTQSVNNAIATTLIGKEVKATGDSLELDSNGHSDAEMLLHSQGNVTVKIFDGQGRLVRTIEHPNAGPGWVDVEWDGRNDAGATAAPGTYRMEVSQAQADGSTVPVPTFVTGMIDGVRFEDGATYLIVGGRKITLSDILEINAVSGIR